MQVEIFPKDNMCRQNSPVHRAREEEIVADESLLIYCKPVELYNILYRRGLHNVIYHTFFLLHWFALGFLNFQLSNSPIKGWK